MAIVENSKEFIMECIDGYEKNESLVLSLWDESKLIGMVSIHKFDWINKESGVGYWLSEEYRGLGLMTTACQYLDYYGFKTLLLNRITISCAVGNAKSRAIPKRLGFKIAGTIKNKEWLYDRFVDHVIYERCNDHLS